MEININKDLGVMDNSENECKECGFDMGDSYTNCGSSEDGVCPECGTEHE